MTLLHDLAGAVDGCVVSGSGFDDVDAIWCNGKELAHLDDERTIDVRVGRQHIRARGLPARSRSSSQACSTPITRSMRQAGSSSSTGMFMSVTSLGARSYENFSVRTVRNRGAIALDTSQPTRSHHAVPGQIRRVACAPLGPTEGECP